MRMIGWGLSLGLLGVVLLMVSSGFAGGGAAGTALSASSSIASSATSTSGSGSFNFSSSHPTWNSGNLCTPVTTGDNQSCTYSGYSGHHHQPATDSTTAGNSCHCHQSALTYNFSSGYVGFNYTIKLSNLDNQNVYLNFGHTTNTITIIVSGCEGGTLNISVLSEVTVNLEISASSVKVALYLYSNSLHYFSWISGDHNVVSTYLVSARAKQDFCPSFNNTNTDSYGLDMTGYDNVQGIVFVDGNGPGSAPHGVHTTGRNSVWFENTTQFTCSWTWAPSSTCHHGYGPAEVQAVNRSED